MGYYTYFNLTITDSKNNEIEKTRKSEIIAELHEECEEAKYSFDEDGNAQQENKWYDADKDMKAFSKKHPDLIFCLEGEGEESGDLWRTYYKDGKMQHARAEIVYPDYNENELV